LTSFAGRGPFDPATLQKIEQLKAVYGMDYGEEASHRMIDEETSNDGT